MVAVAEGCARLPRLCAPDPPSAQLAPAPRDDEAGDAPPPPLADPAAFEIARIALSAK